MNQHRLRGVSQHLHQLGHLLYGQFTIGAHAVVKEAHAKFLRGTILGVIPVPADVLAAQVDHGPQASLLSEADKFPRRKLGRTIEQTRHDLMLVMIGV